VLFFLLRRDYRAAATAAASCAVTTGAGFLLDPRDSARYWTSVITETGRPGTPAYAANQSIQGVLARAGLDPHAPAGAAAWLALSAVVLALACVGMRRAFAGSADAWALSLNAFAALLISPISWSHHWVWGETAVLTLALLGRRHRRRGALIAAAGGLAVFAAAPQWWFPSGGNRELHWAAWQQVAGAAYVIFASVVLLLSARGCLLSANTRYIVGSSLVPAKALGFGGTLWLRNTRCGSVTPSGTPRRPSYANTSPADGSTKTS
jgi:alpha-1,2-mannosyltransferase